MATHRFSNIGKLAGLYLGLSLAQPAWCDQWVNGLTITAAHLENFNNAPLLYFQIAQTVLNPHSCPAADGYAVTDPIVINQAYAAILTAMATQQTISVYVSSAACAVDNRPLAETIQLP